MIGAEYPAGSNQLLVVYTPPDTSVELDPMAIATEIAADATTRASSGWRIVSTADMPLRHAGTFLGQQGSGFETKAAVLVVYARATAIDG
ncbi:MAG TPA: hypothetical protein VGM49_04765 [Candidatus Limnocylindrales bacterium]|jgi:hypothetical protein